MLHVFKIMNDIDIVECSIFFDMNTDPSNRGHDQNFFYEETCQTGNPPGSLQSESSL